MRDPDDSACPQVRGDKVCCVADLPHDPFVLLGCASGSLRVALLADSGGQPVTQPRAVRKLKVSPYRGTCRPGYRRCYPD